MLIAIPSDAPGGLDATLSEHFGHCAVFTLVRVEDETVGEVSVVANNHDEGGCLSPVTLLGDRGADILLAGGMGARPLAGFQDAGITVLCTEDAGTVREAVDLYLAGKCSEFGQEHTCGGEHGGGCGGHHDHRPILRETVDGPVEKDRVVFISFRLRDEQGELLDDVDGLGYLHGHDGFIPGVERALEGHVAGDEVTVTITPEDGYGDRDESQVITVPAAQLPVGVEVGMVVHASSPDGHSTPLTVVSIEGGEATLDANHPLAGKTLNFELKVISVQAAAPEDLEEHDDEHDPDGGCCGHGH